MKKILCMGSINMDLVMYANRIPSPGETVVTDNFQTFPGGKGGNQAVAAAKLGGNVKYFTKLGDDSFSQQLKHEQISHGVCMDDVIYEKGKTAGIAMIMVDDRGQNSILFTPGANADLSTAELRNHTFVFEGCDILQITMEIHPNLVYEAIRIAKEKEMTVVLDPAPAPSNMIPQEITQQVDYVKPNETEAEILTGVHINDIESAKKALFALNSIGFKHPIISLGESGIVTFIDGKPVLQEVEEVSVVDTTAAGDIFLGGFVAAMARGETFKEGIRFAQKAAAISVTRKGAQSSIPSLIEVEQALSSKNK